MNRRLGAAIVVVASASGVMLLWATRFPVGNGISVNQAPNGIILGLIFWIVLALAGSSLAVRMPGGSLVDVAYAPMVAAMSLGGPAVVGLVALVGTTQRREISREVPWYGVVANHSLIVFPAVLSAIVLQQWPARNIPAVDFAATLACGALFFLLNFALAGVFLALRSGHDFWSSIRADAGAWANMLALAPLAWLMAQMYVRAWWAVLLFAVPLYTTRLAYQRFVEVREMFTQTVRSLAEAVDKRDKFTSGHSRRVQEIAVDIGRAMKCSDNDLEALEWGGLLHDIGKIGVPDAVLLKQERLTQEERKVMNSHPVLGEEILSPVTRLAPELPIIRHHHEWFNGSGYPDRLVGDQIPRLARILHVADAFEAMTAPRPYRMTPLTETQALAELRKFGGIQFDPDVVDAFVKTRWAKGAPDSGREERRDVPLIGQVAGSVAGLASAPPTVGPA